MGWVAWERSWGGRESVTGMAAESGSARGTLKAQLALLGVVGARFMGLESMGQCRNTRARDAPESDPAIHRLEIQ